MARRTVDKTVDKTFQQVDNNLVPMSNPKVAQPMDNSILHKGDDEPLQHLANIILQPVHASCLKQKDHEFAPSLPPFKHDFVPPQIQISSTQSPESSVAQTFSVLPYSVAPVQAPVWTSQFRVTPRMIYLPIHSCFYHPNQFYYFIPRIETPPHLQQVPEANMQAED